MDNLVGYQLGPYEIREHIGAGAMATVYKAYHAALDRFVAVKVLSPDFAHDEAFLKRFEQEAQVIAKFRHSNIVQVYDFKSEGDLVYIVMEYVEGGSLKDRPGEPLDLQGVLQVTIEVAGALSYAHQHNIIHRDVKPGNILLDDQGHALLSDFGLAKKLKSSSQLTKTGIGLGTSAYVAPEQAQGLDVNAHSDIYALGATLYEIATGCVPFEADTDLAVVMKHITEPVRPPRELNPDLPVALEQIILRAMAKEPSDRYQSAQEIQQALEEVRDRETKERHLQELEALYSQGMEYAESKKWQAALDTFRELLGIAPHFKDAAERQVEIEMQIELEDLYHQGMERFAQADWQGAIHYFIETVRIDADHEDVSASLKEARRQQMLDIAYSEALSHLRKGKWGRARERFEAVLAEEPGYQDADQLLEKARNQERLAEWYGEAQEHLRRENWQQAVGYLQRVVDLNSDYEDARASLERAQEEHRLEELYQDGMQLFERQSWQNAKESFDEILQIRRNYRDVGKKLKEVNKQLRLVEQFEKAQECESAEEWSEAIGIYIGILTEDAGYPQVAERLARAQKEKELLEKYRQAESYLVEEEWALTIELLKWIVERREDYKNAAQRLQQVRDKREADILYAEGVEYFKRGKWSLAAEKLQRVAQLDPDNEGAARMLENAQRSQRAADLRREGVDYLNTKQLQKAIQRFEQALDVISDDQRAKALLEEAKERQREEEEERRRTARELYEEAKQQEAVVDLDTLIQMLDQILELDPANQEVREWKESALQQATDVGTDIGVGNEGIQERQSQVAQQNDDVNVQAVDAGAAERVPVTPSPPVRKFNWMSNPTVAFVTGGLAAYLITQLLKELFPLLDLTRRVLVMVSLLFILIPLSLHIQWRIFQHGEGEEGDDNEPN